MRADHKDYLILLRKLRKIPKVKKVFIRSGIRFDYLMADKDESFFRELVKYHISGQLKVAPEHVADKVLAKMGKPEHAVYQKFVKKYEQLNRQEGYEPVSGAVSIRQAPAQNRNVRTNNAKNNSHEMASSAAGTMGTIAGSTTENISRNTSTNRKKGSQSEKAHRRQ